MKRDNEPQKKDQAPGIEAIDQTWSVYVANQAQCTNAAGWVKGCDGLLWTSLCKVSGGCQAADIFAAEDNGKWYRSADHQCFVNGTENGSDSTISKDMFVGLFTYLWDLAQTDHDTALAAIERVIAYGEGHDWVMGEAKDTVTQVSKTVLSPALITVLYDMQEKLGGKLALTGRKGLDYERLSERFGLHAEEIKEMVEGTDNGGGSSYLQDSSDSTAALNTGFRAHLDVVKILLEGRIHGAINDLELNTLKGQGGREENNALFTAARALYTDKQFDESTAVLNKPEWFPVDRLPGSQDRCEQYLFQRDYMDGDAVNSDWLPCPEKAETHCGVDLGYARKVIHEGLN